MPLRKKRNRTSSPKKNVIEKMMPFPTDDDIVLMTPDEVVAVYGHDGIIRRTTAGKIHEAVENKLHPEKLKESLSGRVLKDLRSTYLGRSDEGERPSHVSTDYSQGYVEDLRKRIAEAEHMHKCRVHQHN